jgi:hypothetical protein
VCQRKINKKSKFIVNVLFSYFYFPLCIETSTCSDKILEKSLAILDVTEDDRSIHEGVMAVCAGLMDKVSGL